MRCQKVRSCLPAYSRGELAGREVLAVREHLATCASCRHEEIALRALSYSARELPKVAMSADFNTRLLNRLGQERFVETRTKAYFPRRAPSLFWRRAVPVLAGTAVVAVIAVGMLAPRQGTTISFTAANRQLDNSYLTVQPKHNPNMNTRLDPAWSLTEQLAQHERLSQLSGRLTNPSGFTNVYSRTSFDWGTSYQQNRDDLMRVRPVYRVFQPANTTMVTEEQSTY